MPVVMNVLRVSMARKASAHNVPMAPSPETLARLVDFLRKKLQIFLVRLARDDRLYMDGLSIESFRSNEMYDFAA